MNLLSFNWPKTLCPPDKYRYTFPSGYVVKADDRGEWFAAIKKHAKDNGITLPDGWEALAEDQLCRVLPPGMCRYGDGTVPVQTVDIRMTPDGFMRGMGSLLRVALTGEPLVEQEVAEERARICASCPANVNIAGCASCADVADSIAKIRGARKTEGDAVLRHCAICLCSNKSQVWVKEEILAKAITPKMRAQFQTLSHCWKKDITPLA